MRLLEVRNLTVALPPGADRPHAVENVSFALDAGEILCIVGESGSGKSVSAGAIMGLLPPALEVLGGGIDFEGRDVLGLKPTEMRLLRGSRIGMIFQEPMTALNPLMRVGDQIAEVLKVHGVAGSTKRVQELIEAVQLPDPDRIARSYPHLLSGGQRQRVMIAMALALEPAVLIADEPTTALDVTTQMQILGLIKEIQSRRGMGVLFITHDFGVVAEIADRVAVMQQGRIVESGPAAQVLNDPRHAYTKALIAAVPHRARVIEGSSAGRPVLELIGVRKSYWRSGGFLSPKVKVSAVQDADIVLHKGETLGLVGQIHAGALHRQSRETGGRRYPVPRHGPAAPDAPPLEALSQANPDGVPGSLCVAQSPPPRGRNHRGRPHRAWPAPGSGAAAGGRPAGAGPARSQRGRAVSA